MVEKNITIDCQLGRSWWKVQKTNQRPTGEDWTHSSLQQYYYWDNTWRFPSCAGRRFDEALGLEPSDYLSDFMKAPPAGAQVSCNGCENLSKHKKYFSCGKKQYERQYMNYGDVHSLHYCNEFCGVG